MNDLMQKEWEQWQAICGALLCAGIVKQSDLESPQSFAGSPGAELLRLIREWGESRFAQGGAK